MIAQTIDTIFMIIFGIFGLILFGMSADAYRVMNKECTNPTVYYGLTAVMSIGAILVTMAIAYGMCIKSHKCYTKQEGDKANTFIQVCLLISILLIGILAGVGNSMGKSPDCNKYDSVAKRLKFNIWGMFGISVLVFVGSTSAIVYLKRAIPKALKVEVEELKEAGKEAKAELKKNKYAGFDLDAFQI